MGVTWLTLLNLWQFILSDTISIDLLFCWNNKYISHKFVQHLSTYFKASEFQTKPRIGHFDILN